MNKTNQIFSKHSALSLLFIISVMCSFGQSFLTNGNASYLGGLCYELTPDAQGMVGTIFSGDAINLTQPFLIEGMMNFGTKDGIGADGIVFILTPNPASIGGGGGGIGYVGITPSIGVEFDTYYNNTYFDLVNDHMAITANGAVVHSPPSNLSGPLDLGNLETGQNYCFIVSWNPINQTLTAGLNGNYLSYSGNIINSIFGGNPIVHYGFSSATGLAYNRHTVCVVPLRPEPIPDVTICQGETIQLQADLNGTSWTWQPHPTLSNPNISNPFVSPVTTTSYIVGVHYLCNATRYDTVVVTVNPVLNNNASNNGPQCEGENITLNAWGGDSYNWSGPLGFSSDITSPVLFGVTTSHVGTYVVTITDDNGCTSISTTVVNVNPNPVVNIVAPSQLFCETGDPVQIMATPAGGNWEGEIGTDGVFNPPIAGVGTHVIGYYYVDANSCSASTEIELTVVPNTGAAITPPGPFCEDENLISLNANPTGGIWGGVANSSGQIFPNILSAGIYNVSYALTLSTACYDTEIQIEVVAGTTLEIPVLPDFCDEDPNYQLTEFEPPGGIWSGAASSTGLVQPQDLGPGIYQVTYTFDPPVCPVVSGSASFSVFGSPSVQNIERNCDATAAAYIVQFEITGGDPSSYIVNGSVPGDIQSGNPAVFTSDPIPTGSSYTFSIYDDNHCDTIVVTGNYSCNCITSPGNMNQASITACEGESITVPTASGYTLDPNDAIIYVLHTGNPFDYILIGDGAEFFFEPPLETGVTYFVDALIGNTIAGGGVDLTDPCLAITHGPTVMWQANPTGYFSAPTDICSGDDVVITFTMTGEGPFDITYFENNNPYIIEGVSSPYSITVNPEFNTSYTFFSLTDLAGSECSTEIDSTIDIAVGEAVEMEFTYTICHGDSIFLEGEFQNTPGIYHDVFPGTASCDTLVTSTLIVTTGSTSYVNGTTCHISEAGVFEN
ncbi:MAG TPA: L-type lectin-domain containing protein, partial [Saprospiraceae bacterium]|nr:L-type lectin-domain containing protein [Saprospiraceae bacterium]